MNTIEIVFTALFGLLGLSFVAVAIRYPKEVFIDIPLGILKWPIDSIKDHLLFFDSDIKHDNYKTQQKLVIDFQLAEKTILIWSEDQNTLKKEIREALESIDETKIEQFGFKGCSHRTIIIPPQTITFYTFHYLVQWLDEHFMSVGMVELPRISYSVYNDPHTINLIGETTNGKKFFISLTDNDDKQFLRVNNSISTNPEFDFVKLWREIVHSLSQ